MGYTSQHQSSDTVYTLCSRAFLLIANVIIECFPFVCQVNQAQSNPLGSGLGYLEHICQLIEKIGQLQEHNLKLQKQICILHKESKMKKTKEVVPMN